MGMANKIIQLTDGSDNLFPQAEIINKSTASFFTASSGITVNSKYWYQSGKVAFLYLNLSKTDSTAFANGRINAGTLANGYRPAFSVSQIVPASNAVNSYGNRQSSTQINTDGAVFLDNFFSNDIKGIYLKVSYLIG